MKPMRAFFRMLLLLFLSGTGKKAIAQRHPFYNLSVESGLLQSQARALVQDARGFLWIATLGGLSRYDGTSFRNYTVRDGLQSNMLTSLALAKDSGLWIGSVNGLSRFNGQTFRHYPLGGEKRQVTQLKTAADGTLWGISGGQLFSCTQNKISYLSLPQPSAAVTALLPAPDSSLWVAIAGGRLYRFHQKTVTSFAVPATGTSVQVVSAIIAGPKGNIWLATRNGLYTVSGDTVVPARAGNLILDRLPPVTSLATDRNQGLWGGIAGGAFRLQDSDIVFFNKKNGLTDNTIPALLTDAEGNVWLASDGRGIYRYSGTQFTVLDESAGLPGAQVMSMEAGGNGELFLGTYEAGLFLYAHGVVKPLALPGSPPVTALRFKADTLWLGTGGAGLWRYNGTRFSLVPQSQTKLQSSFITVLYPDKSNRLWIGSNNGVSYLREGRFFSVPLAGEAAQDFLEIGTDSILIAATSGLKLFTGNKVYPFKTGSAPDSATPQCLALQGGGLWIGTSDNGLIYYHLQTGKTLVLNKQNALQSDFVYNVIADDNGDLWAGTGYGINRIRYAGREKPVVRFYGRAQGIAGMESNHNAVLKMPDGSLWFGTTNGALHYRPQPSLAVARPLSVMLRSVSVFGEPVTDTSWYAYRDTWYQVPHGLRLPYKKNNVTFTFSAVSLSGSETLRYRYRLDGLEAPWSDWANTGTVTFSALPPGRYRLLVQCSANGKEQLLQELTYPFEIITPFHKTGWFRLLILAGCILLGISFQHLLHRRKRSREKLIEELRREEQLKVRERTAEDFHDEVGNKLTRINVLTNVLKQKVAENPDTSRIIAQIQDSTAQLYSGTRDILWSLRPSNDNLYEILHRIRDFGNELLGDTDVQFLFTGTDERWRQYRLPLDKSRNLIMIFKEALNNALKYAGATEVQLQVSLLKEGILQMTLTDNGTGFDLQQVKRGQGINNMQVRANRIGGSICIDSHPGKGTLIRLTFMLPLE